MTTKKLKEYSLFVHGKQGDELALHDISANGRSDIAIQDWAAIMRRSSDRLMRIGHMLTGFSVVVHAEGHHISFEPCDDDAIDRLELMVSEHLLQAYEYQDEDYADANLDAS